MTTFPTTLKPTPSIAAIATAARNGNKMDAQGYTMKQSTALDFIWYVILPNAPRSYYVVNTNARTCTCKQYHFEGICKHQYKVDEELHIRDLEANGEPPIGIDRRGLAV